MSRIVFLALLALASSAHADTTAIYANAAAKVSMTIETASNGNVREVMAHHAYYFVGGKDYVADWTDTGVIVMRVDGLAKLMAEKLARAAEMGIAPVSPAPMVVMHKGSVAIGKWNGDAYYVQAANGQLSDRPVTVISHDPSLAELGRALKRQYAKSEMMMGHDIKGHAPMSNMGQVLSSGTPISFDGADLQSVSFDPIPKREFVLPARPVSIDVLRRSMFAHVSLRSKAHHSKVQARTRGLAIED
jgi:hypothetical protein